MKMSFTHFSLKSKHLFTNNDDTHLKCPSDADAAVKEVYQPASEHHPFDN